MDSFLAVEGRELAGWTGTSISYFCRSHTPPTLTLLTRISQIGCDSPALAVEAKFRYSLTVNVELFPRLLFFPLGVRRSVLHTGEHTLSLELARCQIRSPTCSPLNTTRQLWWFMSHKSVVHELYQPAGAAFVSVTNG